MRFWDSSALVPLVAGQPSSAEAEAWIARDDEVVVWILAEIEVVSALWRLVRDGAVPEREAIAAESLAGEWMRRAHVVTAVDDVKDVARRLIRVHRLRAADAMQLGAALMWADHRPAGLILHTFDRRLGAAAALEGFDVVPAARS